MGNTPIVITVKSNYASYNLKDNSLLKEIEDIETYKTKSFDFLKLYSKILISKSFSSLSEDFRFRVLEVAKPAISANILKWEVNQLIVGLPLNVDGSDQEITLAAKKFSRRLRAKFNLPVALVDERYSTKHARSSTNFHRHEKAQIDSCAAAVILETWLRQDCD